jgi:alanine dehydrogenase
MPGAVPRTSTLGLNEATLPFGLAIANKGLKAALNEDPHLMNGLNTHQGFVTYGPLATLFKLPLQSLND